MKAKINKRVKVLLVTNSVILLSVAMLGPIYALFVDEIGGSLLDASVAAGFEWGLWESMNYFSLAAGAVIGGLIVTYHSFNALFILMSVLCLFSAFYLYLLPKKYI